MNDFSQAGIQYNAIKLNGIPEMPLAEQDLETARLGFGTDNRGDEHRPSTRRDGTRQNVSQT